MARSFVVVFSAIVFALLLQLLPFDAEINKGLSLLFLVAVLWLTEALHITITALLVPVLAVALGLLPTAEALSSFADPIIFLFLGGFALASALKAQGLDRALAGAVLRLSGGGLGRALLLLFAVTAGLSMWVSNTATAAMMLPLTLSLLNQMEDKKNPGTWVFALLGLACSANIGGIATLVGSPPNAIAAAEVGMSFMDWLRKALPITLLLLPAAIYILYAITRPNLRQRIVLPPEKIYWDHKKRIMLGIFLLTVLAWIFSTPLNGWLGGFAAFDSLVAVVAMLALAVFGVVQWHDIEQNTEWGVLILFGGGLCLSAVLKASGTSLFLGQGLGAYLSQAGPLITLLVLVTFVVFLTEFASNTATAALLIPVFVALAQGMGLDPVAVASVIAISASCAFMLPVATPPNAIVFGTGLVPQKSMVKAGFWLNLACIAIIVLYAYLFW